jgi:hypothetical protein
MRLKRENIHTDRYCNASGEICHAKESKKENIKKCLCTGSKSMYVYIGNKWSHRNSQKKSLMKNV